MKSGFFQVSASPDPQPFIVSGLPFRPNAIHFHATNPTDPAQVGNFLMLDQAPLVLMAGIWSCVLAGQSVTESNGGQAINFPELTSSAETIADDGFSLVITNLTGLPNFILWWAHPAP